MVTHQMLVCGEHKTTSNWMYTFSTNSGHHLTAETSLEKKPLKRLTTTSLSQTWTLRYISKKGLSLVQVISGIKYRLSGDKGFILFYCLLNSSLNLFNFVQNHIFKCLIAYRTRYLFPATSKKIAHTKLIENEEQSIRYVAGYNWMQPEKSI